MTWLIKTTTNSCGRLCSVALRRYRVVGNRSGQCQQTRKAAVLWSSTAKFRAFSIIPENIPAVQYKTRVQILSALLRCTKMLWKDKFLYVRSGIVCFHRHKVPPWNPTMCSALSNINTDKLITGIKSHLYCQVIQQYILCINKQGTRMFKGSNSQIFSPSVFRDPFP